MTIEGDSDPVQITTNEAIISGIVKFALDPERQAHGDDAQRDMHLERLPVRLGEHPPRHRDLGALKSEVEKQIVKAVKEEVPGALSGALDNIALPKELDLKALGVVNPVPIASRFDHAVFDIGGGTLSLQALFGNAPAPGTPGATAPGSLVLGGTFEVGKNRPGSIGISLSLDALNQLLFAAWGTGSISFKAADTTLSPKLPPLMMLDDQASLD